MKPVEIVLKIVLVTNAEIEESLNKLTEEEQYCERHFVENVSRNDDGRYIVRIPFKNGLFELILGNSRKCAIASLFSLEKRFTKNSQLAIIKYKNFIDEYVNLGHI